MTIIWTKIANAEIPCNLQNISRYLQSFITFYWLIVTLFTSGVQYTVYLISNKQETIKLTTHSSCTSSNQTQISSNVKSLLAHSNIAFTDCDARACYDWVVPEITALAQYQAGPPDYVVLFFLGALKQMNYCIVIIYGIDQECIESAEEQPI
eukprot:15342661-Ditylum_brightwellii.AAC.2